MAQASPSEYERLGGRRLGVADAVAQSVGFLGPVFSSAFLVPLVVGIISATQKGGGEAAPLSVILATVGVAALGWLVARYARQVHAAGGLYDYVSRGLGERPGVAAGVLYYVGILLLSIGIIVLIGGYVHTTIESEWHKSPLPQWGWSAIVVVLLLAVLYTGVRISTRLQLALATVSFLVVLGFLINVVVKVGRHNSWTPFQPHSASLGWSGIFFGVLYGVLLFVGFETAANLGEETRNPRRAIPVAVLATVAIAALYYVFATYAELAGYHFSVGAMANNALQPLFPLANPGANGYGAVWLRRLLELVVLLDMLAVTLGTGVSGTRGVFALARDRRLPSGLAAVSKRHGTPVAAMLLLGVLATVNIVLTQTWTGLFAQAGLAHYFSMFLWDSTFGGFALICVYFLMCVGSIVSFATEKGRVISILAALVGIAITAGAIWASFYKVTRPTLYAPYGALGVLVVGFLIALLTRGRKPASLHLEDLAVNPDLARMEPLQVDRFATVPADAPPQP